MFTTRPGRRAGSPAIHRLDGEVFADGLAKYAGLSVPSMNRAGGRSSGLWDIRRVPLSMQFTRANRYIMQIFQSLAGDCVSLQMAQVVSAPVEEPAMLSPSLHDFGDVIRLAQSPTQTFTLTNLLPHAIAIPSAPLLTSDIAVSSSNWYRVLAQNCSGQTLAPGSSCSFDIACRPPLPVGSAADSLPRADVRVGWRQVPPSPNYTGELYSVLRCAGVPNGPFTRLEFAPRACFLTDTPVNGTAVTPPLVVRNTSLFPATISRASVNNQMGTSSFSLLSSTCAIGLVLSPNESCDLRALYRARTRASVNQGTVDVEFSSSTDPIIRGIRMDLEARTVLAVSDGETLFKNGFDFGVAQCLE